MVRLLPGAAAIIMIMNMMMSSIPSSAGFLVTPSPADRAAPGVKAGGRKLPTLKKSAMAANGNASVAAAAPGSSGGATSTCRNCKKQFRRDDNEDGACSFHPGFFSGRLNRVNDVDTSGLEYFWSCCGQPDKEHPGCTTGRHASYDDPEEGGVRSPLTGELR